MVCIMLNAIESYVKQFTEVIAAVVGIDVEVVNADMVRVAGTGAYADGVGRSIDSAGELYRSALAGREPLFVENPRSDPRCDGCPDRDHCQEKLTLCAPVAAGCIVLGVIGLVCFTDQDRARVLANRDT